MRYLIGIYTFLTNHLWPNYDAKYKSLIMLIDFSFNSLLVKLLIQMFPQIKDKEFYGYNSSSVKDASDWDLEVSLIHQQVKLFYAISVNTQQFFQTLLFPKKYSS